jgi:hypothetical protein
LGVRDQEDYSSGSVQARKVTLCLKDTQNKKGIAQGFEFKPQYCQKTKRKKNEITILYMLFIAFCMFLPNIPYLYIYRKGFSF